MGAAGRAVARCISHEEHEGHEEGSAAGPAVDEVGEDLPSVDRSEGLDRLQLDDDLVDDEEVRSEPLCKLFAASYAAT